jgi:hypothetical protein
MSTQSPGQGEAGLGEATGKTMPQMPARVTMTLSKHPWTLIVTFTVSVVFVVIFSVIQSYTKTITPAGTVDKLISTFRNGDVETLLDNPELNYRQRALRDIEKRGLEEYNKVDQAFEACLAVGLEKYRLLRSDVLARGEEAFKTLSPDQQRSVKGLSKSEWIFSKGMEEAGEDELLGEKDPSVFIDEEKGEAFILRLGQAVESGALPEPAASPPPKKGKKGGGKATAAGRTHDLGKAVFEELKKKLYAAGAKAFLDLDKGQRDLIEKKSKSDFVIAEGMKGVAPEDRTFISGPEMFADTADEKLEATRLCQSLITPGQRDLIAGKNYHDFTTKKDVYIMETGRKKYAKFLQALFGGCTYEVRKSVLFGKDPFDIVRVSMASVELEWKECSGVETFIPSTFMLELREGKWRILQGAGSPEAPAAGGGAAVPAGGAQP